MTSLKNNKQLPYEIIIEVMLYLPLENIPNEILMDKYFISEWNKYNNRINNSILEELNKRFLNAVVNNKIEDIIYIKDYIQNYINIINILNDREENIFFIACINGDLEVIKLLLPDYISTINQQNFKGNTIFHIICKYGYIDVLEYILNFGIDVNIQNNKGETGFYIACKKII